ncbi:MAG: hypothetical protein PHX54_07825 [Lentimicrobiaceae bacterium]|nr:hypothetical protein [Lentimicrobiaceae bacterium]
MKNIIIVSIFFISLMAHGQEVIVPLQTNARLKKIAAENAASRQSLDSRPPLTLPFFDDFSGREGYPNPLLWDGEDVFVNDEYAVYPPTVGVATFDAINRL